ncbi:MAG: A/G-specific adenine glycosylase [Campylobacterales bacterium]|nr:A/G-specific adenine glycosylase [Campylobacterales bacterium]
MSKSHLHNAQNKLLAWYEIHGRKDLPWRNTENIYHVYVSEVMLQQTQVKRVLEEYYFQFLEKFPSFFALAHSPLEEVFGMWSGLGYYRRAKNLHESAKLCSDGLPQNLNSLQKLPGIGRYTASAICSFGYQQSVSVVDTNIARVLARYFGVENAKEAYLWELADSFLNISNPTFHNLALMDLGAMVCLPKNPVCKECPLVGGCKGASEPDKYYKVLSKKYENKKLHFGICVRDGKIAMKRSNEGMYKDMLELPNIETSFYEKNLLGTFAHSVTKYRLEVHVYSLDSTPEDVIWVAHETLHEAGISSMTKKALKLYNGVKISAEGVQN